MVEAPNKSQKMFPPLCYLDMELLYKKKIIAVQKFKTINFDFMYKLKRKNTSEQFNSKTTFHKQSLGSPVYNPQKIWIFWLIWTVNDTATYTVVSTEYYNRL